MRYISKAERERPSRFDLLEAHAWLCAECGLSPEDSQELILDLLVDEKQIPRRSRRWHPAPGPDSDPGNLPPGGGEWWRGIEIDWHSDCRVLDDFDWRAWLEADDQEAPPWGKTRPLYPTQRALLLDQAVFIQAAREALQMPGEKPAHQDKPGRGRRTMKAEIQAAYEALSNDGKIDFERPMTKSYPKIRFWITGNEERSPGLGDEVIRTVVSPLFERDKIARKPATPQ